MKTIKELRRLSGLTQAAFAEKIGCPKATVEKWEYRSDPPAYIVKLIKYYLEAEGLITYTIPARRK